MLRFVPILLFQATFAPVNLPAQDTNLDKHLDNGSVEYGSWKFEGLDPSTAQDGDTGKWYQRHPDGGWVESGTWKKSGDDIEVYNGVGTPGQHVLNFKDLGDPDATSGDVKSINQSGQEEDTVMDWAHEQAPEPPQ